MIPWAGRFGCISCLGVWEFQLVGWLVYFSGLHARLGVMWRFSRLVVMGISIVWVAYMYIFFDQKFTNHVHVASLPTVSSHFDTPFTRQNAP